MTIGKIIEKRATSRWESKAQCTHDGQLVQQEAEATTTRPTSDLDIEAEGRMRDGERTPKAKDTSTSSADKPEHVRSANAEQGNESNIDPETGAQTPARQRDVDSFNEEEQECVFSKQTIAQRTSNVTCAT